MEEIPAPAKIAPFSVAISAEVEVAGDELGSGRLVVLHDPAGSAAWEGEFRCVTYARAEVDAEMAIDPLITEVGWSWLLDALERNQAAYTAPSGTVTTVASRSFGGIATEGLRAEIELRASWTPLIETAIWRAGATWCVRPRACHLCPRAWFRLLREGRARG